MNETSNSGDHDLLITIKANLDNITTELRLLRDGTNERLKAVEQNKLERSEFLDYKTEHKEFAAEQRADVEKLITENSSLSKENKDDIKVIYRIIWGIMGGVVILQLFASNIIHYFIR